MPASCVNKNMKILLKSHRNGLGSQCSTEKVSINLIEVLTKKKTKKVKGGSVNSLYFATLVVLIFVLSSLSLVRKPTRLKVGRGLEQEKTVLWIILSFTVFIFICLHGVVRPH